MEIGIHLAGDAFYIIDLPPDRRLALLGFLKAKVRKSPYAKKQEQAVRQAQTQDMVAAFTAQGATTEQIRNFMRGLEWETPSQ